MLQVRRNGPAAIRHWEGAGAMLAHAVQHYLDLSHALEARCLAEGISPPYVAAQIDSTLGSLHVVLGQQIAAARSTLAQTRNRVLSPICRVSEDVLLKIFMDVVFAFNLWDTEVDEYQVIQFYRSLYALLGVCSAWRNIIISRGIFWSIVPMINSGNWYLKTKHTPALSFARAQGTPLHFVALLTSGPGDFSSWVQHAPRLRTANIATGVNNRAEMEILLRSLLYQSSNTQPPSLSELSLRHTYEPEYYVRLPREDEYIINNNFPQHPFNRLTSNLSIFRVKGAQFNWEQMVFSYRLTELHLEAIMLGSDVSLSNFLRALSAATQLSDLKFIGVRSYPPNQMPGLRECLLPNLKTLVLRDLRLNTLIALLTAIGSRSHRLTLFLNLNCLYVQFAERLPARSSTIKPLYRVLADAPVHDLYIDGESEYGWLPADELGDLILNMPDLQTLWFNRWDFDESSCRALVRSSQPRPTLNNLAILNFTQTRVRSQEAFKNMIVSHSISVRSLEFGVIVLHMIEGTLYIVNCDWAGWLRENTSNRGIRVIPHEYAPPEFGEVGWRIRK